MTTHCHNSHQAGGFAYRTPKVLLLTFAALNSGAIKQWLWRECLPKVCNLTKERTLAASNRAICSQSSPLECRVFLLIIINLAYHPSLEGGYRTDRKRVYYFWKHLLSPRYPNGSNDFAVVAAMMASALWVICIKFDKPIGLFEVAFSWSPGPHSVREQWFRLNSVWWAARCCRREPWGERSDYGCRYYEEFVSSSMIESIRNNSVCYV